jgi:CIC family chloride channel protein
VSRARRFQAAARREARRFLLVLLVGVGVLCGLAAVAFHHALEIAHRCLAGLALSLPAGPWRFLAVGLLPAAAGALLAFALPRFSPHAGGGLALVRAAYARHPRRLDLRAWLGTFLATPLSLGAGTPLGPEGPTVVLTSGLAVGVSRLLALPAPLVRGMVPVGTAAGIAAIFNTPITGVVFALEEVIGTASRGVLGGAIVAAVAAAVVQKTALGGRHLLPASPAAWNHVGELLGFALLGVLAGTFAGLLPRVQPALRSALLRLTRGGGGEAVARGALAGLAVGLLGLIAPDSLGVGYPAVARWLGGGDGGAALAFAAKALGVSIALAAPLVGGVFAPSLFLGASLGAALAHSWRLVEPSTQIDPGAYALVGMGAFFAGFLRTPLSAVLIVFELTGDYALVVPLMLAVALAVLVARKMAPVTLVESQLLSEGIAAEESEDPLAGRRVGEAMATPAVGVRAHGSIAEALAVAESSGHRLFPVLDPAGHVVGVVEREAIAAAAQAGRHAADLAQLMRPAPVLATPDETLDRVSLRLAAHGETRCPVIASAEDPRLVGFLSPADRLRMRLHASVERADSRFEPLQ